MHATSLQSFYFPHQSMKLNRLFSDYNKFGKFSMHLLHSFCECFCVCLYSNCDGVRFMFVQKQQTVDVCLSPQLIRTVNIQWQSCPMRIKLTLTLFWREPLNVDISLCILFVIVKASLTSPHKQAIKIIRSTLPIFIRVNYYHLLSDSTLI